MKKKNWRKHHKWFGLAVCFFMLMFCVSGILLNHRSLIRDIDISRACLPSRYEYKDWNGGLLRGTTKVRDHVLLYGNNGIWITDSTGSIFDDFNEGLPEGADWRQIRNVVAEADADTITSHCDIPLFAASTVGLYRFGAHGKWHSLPISIEPGDKLSDIALQGDTLSVRVQKPGRDPTQGVGYLEDGTMIVVEGGRGHVGLTIDTVVTGVLQTAAGRMVFTRPKETA